MTSNMNGMDKSDFLNNFIFRAGDRVERRMCSPVCAEARAISFFFAAIDPPKSGVN